VPALYVIGAFACYRYSQREDSGGLLRVLRDNIPMLLFIVVATVVTILSFLKRLSLIPVLGLLTCLYLMTQLGVTNWARFAIWLIAGLVIYFFYSRNSSKLAAARVKQVQGDTLRG
jgi:hypothetical protein